MKRCMLLFFFDDCEDDAAELGGRAKGLMDWRRGQQDEMGRGPLFEVIFETSRRPIARASARYKSTFWRAWRKVAADELREKEMRLEEPMQVERIWAGKAERAAARQAEAIVFFFCFVLFKFEP